jgi:hypothetical protein
MCINFETSLMSFLIGELSGLSLILFNYCKTETETETKSIDYEKIFIGLFVMFYTLVQFCELKIYQTNNNDSIANKLLVLNLGFQGLLFFVLMSLIYKINGIYILICGLVSIIIIIETIFGTTNIKLTESKCLRWEFMENKQIYLSLGLMYFMIFFWVFVEPNSNFIKYVGFVLLFTLIFSYFIFNNIYTYVNSPSIWCLSSAIAAPLFILY